MILAYPNCTHRRFELIVCVSTTRKYEALSMHGWGERRRTPDKREAQFSLYTLRLLV